MILGWTVPLSMFEISQYITEAATIYVVYIHICVSSKKAINLGCNAVITLKHKYDLNADKRPKKKERKKREKKKCGRGACQTSPSGWTACCNRSLYYLSMCGRYIPASIHPKQGVVWQWQVELDVGRMMHSHMKPPKKSRRDRLALMGSNVDLTTVDGSASHPLLCRQKRTQWWYCFDTYSRFTQGQLITNLMSLNISVISGRTNDARLIRPREWVKAVFSRDHALAIL